MMVIDEMEPADRCRFTRCSRLCDKEAKDSKNYIYELILDFNPNRITRIYVIHENMWPIENTGYILVFNSRSETKLKTYMNQTHETLWETELDNDTDVAQLALEEFKSIIQKYQRNVRQLRIIIDSPRESTEKIGMIDFGIESLDSLEHLTIEGDGDTLNIFSKLRKPLKTLWIEQYDNSGNSDYGPIYQVQDSLDLFEAKLDNQQFFQLSAKRVAISIGKLTEKDIFSFIRSWQDGTIGKDIESYYWELYDSEFNKQKLLKLLRISDFDGQREILEIKHFKEAGRSAKLYIDNNSINFRVPK